MFSRPVKELGRLFKRASGQNSRSCLIRRERLPDRHVQLIPIRLIWITLMFCGAVLFAAEPGATVAANQKPNSDNPKLPRVMIIGDSISVGYTDGVREKLAGKANVYRVPGNAGPSSSGVQKVDEWIAPTSGKWDVIHFNFGLHDVKLGTGGKDNRPYPTADGRQVPADEYERNLRQIVARLKSTGAALIWASTTPIPAGKLDPLRRPGDEVKYNEIARKVMIENGVAIDDLYGAITAGKSGLQQPANVHFTKEGSALLAQQVAQSIDAALQRRTH